MLYPTPVRLRGPQRRPTPAQPQGSFDMVVKTLNEIRAMYQDFKGGLAIVRKALATFQDVKRGEKGDVGRTGMRGTDGNNATMEMVQSAVNGAGIERMVTAAVRGIYVPPADGVSPSVDDVATTILGNAKFLRFIKKNLKHGDPGKTPDAEAIRASILEQLKTDLDEQSVLALIEKRFAEIRNHVVTQGGGDKRKGGGGDTVAAGTNIVLTTNAQGDVVISALGGTSGKDVVTQYSLAAVQSGSDVTIDLTQLAHWATFSNLIAAYRNNIPQTETVNFTVVGSTLTILGADASEVFNVTYAYTS